MRPGTRQIEVILWTTAAVLALAAARGWRATSEAGQTDPRAIPAATKAPMPVNGDSLASAARYAVEHDPFRLERRPSSTPFVPGIERASPPPPAPPTPTLVLAGIMGGPPWQGIIEGIPGTSGGTVVREGQQFGELRVLRVTRAVVVVGGADTTWTLRVRRTW